jgi:hypothetical protein
MYKTKFRQRLCRNPQNFTADVADEMKLSKATVSRLAKQMIKAGFSEIVTRDFERGRLGKEVSLGLPRFAFRIRVPKTQSAFHPHAPRNAFRRRGVRKQ